MSDSQELTLIDMDEEEIERKIQYYRSYEAPQSIGWWSPDTLFLVHLGAWMAAMIIGGILLITLSLQGLMPDEAESLTIGYICSLLILPMFYSLTIGDALHRRLWNKIWSLTDATRLARQEALCQNVDRFFVRRRATDQGVQIRLMKQVPGKRDLAPIRESEYILGDDTETLERIVELQAEFEQQARTLQYQVWAPMIQQWEQDDSQDPNQAIEATVEREQRQLQAQSVHTLLPAPIQPYEV